MKAETDGPEDDQAVVVDSETAPVPVEEGPWQDDEDFFMKYQY